jgi:hypothetical protein
MDSNDDDHDEQPQIFSSMRSGIVKGLTRKNKRNFQESQAGDELQQSRPPSPSATSTDASLPANSSAPRQELPTHPQEYHPMIDSKPLYYEEESCMVENRMDSNAIVMASSSIIKVADVISVKGTSWNIRTNVNSFHTDKGSRVFVKCSAQSKFKPKTRIGNSGPARVRLCSFKNIVLGECIHQHGKTNLYVHRQLLFFNFYFKLLLMKLLIMLTLTPRN